ncbi:unnamed protein product [Zymoseptoria tritici ST99CH_3D1]|uniref:Cytochrome b561 domain-containing protein n=3 Tax=Zymoseptoria tritici TaxID=1047171 RepID=F9WXY5_ZYMTI|nr:uncharacterized protein MYCGRDRAFT_65963 [Zymoseptoria tritici IPO323]EGP91220.1 hypothetical protein MYCGRDRAFT_65963 [Zymoseptoria tritici IPO323]SMQ45791.1 unnamed protein product [Zymoseptoria tritici ST99CH_3D7]SMR42136.1 unnamed protein product [Zymoseptoria tritici ST99CH_1E4]SMR44317.1 unnamed protein product [Zymoseptoria tritici ST99CH_3D1]
MKAVTATTALLGLASMATAQSSVASICDPTDVCYALNVPQTTISSGSGDIYFQMTAPTTYAWVALGQGSGMAGSNIFVMYTSADGTNVTVSPRLGTGYVEPQHDTTAQIDILEGSGVSNGKMTANVRCKNCNSWSGGSMDFTSSSDTNWIHAYKQGSPMNTDDLTADIRRHDNASPFKWNLAAASGGADANPFVASSSSSTANTTSTTATTSSSSSSSSAKKQKDILLAHGVLACVAVVAIFPSGGILIRVASFTGLVWVHAALQLLGYFVYIAAFGLGLWLAKTFKYFGKTHPRIGIVVFALLAFQPVFGFVHHLLFKKQGRRTLVGIVHANTGRVVILLGIINGGLGLKLKGSPKKDMIAYGVCAGIMGVAYLAAIILGEVKIAKRNKSAPEALGSDMSMEENKSHSNHVS